MNEDNFPEQLRRCFSTEYWNGFGFELFERKEKSLLILFKFKAKRSREEFLSLISKELKVETADIILRSGLKYVCIEYIEWERIPDLFNWFLEKGYTLWTQNKFNVQFRPGEQFSLERMERNAVADLNRYIMFCYKKKIPCKLNLYVKFSYISHWNWSTKEGKNLCTLLRRIFGETEVSFAKPRYIWKGYDETCKKYGVLHRGKWSAYEPSMRTVYDTLLVERKDRMKVEEAAMCLISFLKLKRQN